MITLTAIVLALFLGWGVIKAWNALFPAPARQEAKPETREQAASR
jgi:hypothetical protein